MNKRNKSRSKIAYIILLILVVLMFLFLIFIDNLSEPNIKGDSLERISMIDLTINTDDEEIKHLTYDELINGSFIDGDKIIVRGKINNDMDDVELIHFYTRGLNIGIKVNGNEVFNYGYNSEFCKAITSVGSRWITIKIDNIKRYDDIEIVMEKNIKDGGKELYTQAFEKLCYGNYYNLLRQQFDLYRLKILISLVTLIIGIIYVMILFIYKLLKLKNLVGLYACGFLLIFSSLYTIIDYNYITLLFSSFLIICAIEHLLLLLICICFLIYTKSLLKTKKYINRMKILIYIWVLALILYFETLLMLKVDQYLLMNIISWTAGGLLLISMLYSILDLALQKSTMKRFLLVVTTILGLSIIMEVLKVTLLRVFCHSIFEFCFVIFTMVHLFNFVFLERENVSKAAMIDKMQKEVENNKVAILINQIQPHFFANSLSSIARLCDIDAQKAKFAITEFSAYLRVNFEALTENTLVPFKVEIKNVEHYLSLEKIRFGEDLKIVYDFKITDFRIPTLTLQPILENAVKHGIGKNEDGGTVTILTEEDKHNYIIKIIDDGAGFDVSELNKDDKKHIGINNVTYRINSICNGSLEIKSAIGVGTVAVFKIPKEDVS